jgi:hypothetical protein
MVVAGAGVGGTVAATVGDGAGVAGGEAVAGEVAVSAESRVGSTDTGGSVAVGPHAAGMTSATKRMTSHARGYLPAFMTS